MAEVTDRQQKKYYPSLAELMTCCEVNYMLLNRLLPEETSVDSHYQFEISKQIVYRLSVIEISRYTCLIRIKQINNALPDYFTPSIEARLYHDARVAEVIKSHHMGRIKAKYEYPNDKMHQPDEKMRVNHFLNEWLKFCLDKGLSQAEDVVLSLKD